MANAQHRGGAGNFAANPERAAQAGRKGGRMSGGNFRNDPERAAIAGQKGGQASGGNFRNDPKRASRAGRKGGQETPEAAQEDKEDKGSGMSSPERPSATRSTAGEN